MKRRLSIEEHREIAPQMRRLCGEVTTLGVFLRSRFPVNGSVHTEAVRAVRSIHALLEALDQAKDDCGDIRPADEWLYYGTYNPEATTEDTAYRPEWGKEEA